MPVVTVGTENSGPINLYYEDYGSGEPVILIHGYPLSGRAWDKQVPPLLAAGRRVITYDRRGFGKSSQPATGYDWDTFAADLATLINVLGLDRVTLVGHSMGTGEVTRYLGTYGSAKVDRAVLIGPIPPYLSQASDNREGVPANLFDGFRQSAAADGPAWLKGFLDLFYNIDQFRGNRVSDEAYNASFNVAVGMSSIATVACITTWQADFRADLPKIDVPVLVIQGDADRVLRVCGRSRKAARIESAQIQVELAVLKMLGHAVRPVNGEGGFPYPGHAVDDADADRRTAVVSAEHVFHLRQLCLAARERGQVSGQLSRRHERRREAGG
jgi:non-heme chloroperoxidase